MNSAPASLGASCGPTMGVPLASVEQDWGSISAGNWSSDTEGTSPSHQKKEQVQHFSFRSLWSACDARLAADRPLSFALHKNAGRLCAICDLILCLCDRFVIVRG